MAGTNPPLRVRETDGDPNVIPVFEIICSNGTITEVSPGVIRLATGTGAQGPAGSGMGIGSTVAAGTLGSVLFVGSSNSLAISPSTFYWNETSFLLGVGTSAPTVTLDVVGTGRVTGALVLTTDASSAGHAVRANRTLTAVYPIQSGGNLTADRSFALDTAFVLNSGAFPILSGSGGTGITVVGSGGMLLGVSTGGATLEYKVLTAGNNVTITHGGSTVTIASLQTNTGNIYAATGNTYVLIGNAADLTADRALTADLGIALVDSGANGQVYVQVGTPFVVTSNRTINTTEPLRGGGNLGADRTLTIAAAGVNSAGALSSADWVTFNNKVAATRAVNTTEPLRGGGDFSADRTLTIVAAGVNSAGALSSADWAAFNVKASSSLTFVMYAAEGGLSAEKVLVGSTGLTADSAGNYLLSVNPNVRDKLFTFFAASTLSTAMRAEEARVYVPFAMELRDVRLACTTTPVGANIVVNLSQFATPVASGSAIWASADRAIIATGGSVGSAATVTGITLMAGSWLGFSLDQVGTTSSGQDLTITVISRTS